MSHKMTLTIPQDPRFHASLRLFFAGIASTLEATMEEIDDVKLLISEGMNLMRDEVTITISLEDAIMDVTICGERAYDEGLSQIIMESLADEVDIQSGLIRFRKVFGEI